MSGKAASRTLHKQCEGLGTCKFNTRTTAGQDPPVNATGGAPSTSQLIEDLS
jgi:hypothetical protein